MATEVEPIDLLAVVVLLPWLPEEPIASFRAKYDPTAGVVDPHITLVFPVPTSLGADQIREHVRRVVATRPPFNIRVTGLERSWDQWLFLLVADGRDEIVALHDALYTGILQPHLWTERPYVPHVGLGLFVVERDRHDLLEPRPRTLDEARFDAALREATALDIDHAGPIDRVHVVGLDAHLTEVLPLEEIQLGSS